MPLPGEMDWSGGAYASPVFTLLGDLPVLFSLSRTFLQISASASPTSIVLASDKVGKQINSLEERFESVLLTLRAQVCVSMRPFSQ